MALVKNYTIHQEMYGPPFLLSEDDVRNRLRELSAGYLLSSLRTRLNCAPTLAQPLGRTIQLALSAPASRPTTHGAMADAAGLMQNAGLRIRAEGIAVMATEHCVPIVVRNCTLIPNKTIASSRFELETFRM